MSKSRRNLRGMSDPIGYSEGVASLTGGRARAASDLASQRASKKVSICGCGQVGLAIAYAIINQAKARKIALVDINGPKLDGEVKDLCQGSAFHPRVEVVGSTEYGVTEDSQLVIITAGAARKPTETRLDLVRKNLGIMKSIIPLVLDHSPDAAICIVSNPCDVMTAVANKIAGDRVPPGRIFGAGTVLDSSRLRSLIASTLDIDTKSVHGYIIGEHGNSSVPVWSSVRIGGVPLLNHGEEPGDFHLKLHEEVVQTSTDVIRAKGYTNWAIGLSVAHIAGAVLNDARSIMPVSTCVRGFCGVSQDIFLSLPSVVGAHGVVQVSQLPLAAHEAELFLKSAESVWAAQEPIWDEI